MANVISIITMLAALVALTLSIICIVKREKYSSLVVLETDENDIGLQNFDLNKLLARVTALEAASSNYQPKGDYVLRNSPYSIKIGPNNPGCDADCQKAHPNQYMYGTVDQRRVAFGSVPGFPGSPKWLFV